MKPYSLYNDDIWHRYTEKFGTTPEEFQIKSYAHFDNPFNFLKKNKEVQDLVSDNSLKKVAQHAFLPFVKILAKTPRYKYQENEQVYELETKIRPIAFASHFDTYLYGFYSFAITEKYQDYIKNRGFDDSIIAYRTDLNGKCNIQFAKEVFQRIKEFTDAGRTCTAIALDIKGYFDNIEHNILKTEWAKVIGESELPIDQYNVFKSLTKYSYVSKNSILRNFGINLKNFGKKWHSLLDLIDNSIGGKSFQDKFNLLRRRRLISVNLPKNEDGTLSNRGIPQGSPMSALLSNIYLIEFDEWLNRLTKDNNWIYRRYCDDLLIICETEEANNLYEEVKKKIVNYKVKIQAKKTDIIEFKANSKGKIRGINKAEIDKTIAVINPINEHRYYKNLQYLGFEYNGTNIYIRHTSLSRFFRKAKGRITKSVMMAYSSKSTVKKIYKKGIYEKYSHIGRRNFIQYARNAASKTYSNSRGIVREGMDSISIKRQIAAHFSIIEREILKTSGTRYISKAKKNDKRKLLGKKTKKVIYKR